MAAYDIIGDVHGSADKLDGLLRSLGYEHRDGAHRKSGHVAVFVGDLIDRGPAQVEAVGIARAMRDAGTALVVSGNHEFNAIAFATPDPAVPGDFLRSHAGQRGAHNRHLHQSYLDQVGEGSALHAEHIAWFRTLPLALDLGPIRVTHACWHPDSLAVLDAWVPDGAPLGDDFLVAATTRGSAAYDAVEVVLKGPETHLAPEHAWRDPEGTVRRTARLRWWDDSSTSLASMVMIPSNAETPDGEPYPGVPDRPSDEADAFRYRDPVPVVFGHYWFTGRPTPAATYAVCVDYSAVRGDRPLVAYRWDGEPVPTADRFVAFPAVS